MAFLRNISSPSLSDKELAIQYRNTGELRVLGDLYSRYMDLIYGVCLNYLKDPEDARDAVLSIFEELVTKLRQHEVENVKSWLYTLARNHCLMKLRQEKKMPAAKMDGEFMQLEVDGHLMDALNREEQFRQLEVCLEQLADGQRKAVEAFYLRGKCYNEISAELGMEWSTVRSAIQNGRRNLKICMEGRKQKVKTDE